MTYFKIKRENGRLHLDDRSPDAPLTHIYYFLNDDACGKGGALDWIDWINDPTQTLTISNYSLLIKRDGYVIIGFCMDDEAAFNNNAVIVSASSLIRILKEWEEIYEQGAEEVTIYLNGTELSIEWVPKITVH